MPSSSYPRHAQQPLFGPRQEIKEMAGAWAESGSLPSAYFVRFEWTESRTLPPKCESRGPEPPASLPLGSTPRLPLSPQALCSPFPRPHAHSTPATPTPATKDPRAALTSRPPSFLPAGPPPAPAALSPAAPPGKCLTPSEANTPAALPTPSPARAVRPHPGTQATRSALSSRPLPSPLRVTLAWLNPGREAPSWPSQASSPS